MRWIIWQRFDSHPSIRKADMSDFQLAGSRSEYEASPDAKQAGKGALKLLLPHSVHYGSAIANIESVANPDTSPDPSDPDDSLEKAEQAVIDSYAREELQKREGASPAELEKTQRDKRKAASNYLGKARGGNGGEEGGEGMNRREQALLDSYDDDTAIAKGELSASPAMRERKATSQRANEESEMIVKSEGYRKTVERREANAALGLPPGV
jgi:hypothetical protein